MPDTTRKLTTIVAADVVGFSRLMGENESATLEALKACRSIIDEVILKYHGRIFGSAGDSLLAEFPSPVEAVWCAHEFQKLIAERNAHPDTRTPMQFRVGINLGDVIIEGENLYGDGVNVAARLESVAEPGGVCLSGKVHEEVKRKLDLSFADGGTKQLKNIADPVGVFHLRPDVAASVTSRTSATQREQTKPVESRIPDRAKVAVMPFKVIGGDESAPNLAVGLGQDIVDGLARHTAISILSLPENAAPGPDPIIGPFVLNGIVRSAGQRLRMSFTLVDVHDRAQVWSEHYDRTLDDVFELQDEISGMVVTAVRLRVKLRIFELLRAADNDVLTVPELLDKAAGYFVRSYGDNDEVETVLRKAVEKAAGNSMAKAMLAWCLYRKGEFSPLRPPDDCRHEIESLATQAVSLDPSSYFAHVIMALVHQDLSGEFDDALTHAELALEYNPNFSQAQAMRAIAGIHCGEVANSLKSLEDSIKANKDDPHRYRHYRELAIGHFLNGDNASAVRVAGRLVEQTPGLERNRLVLAALLAAAGQTETAKRHMGQLLETTPDLTISTARLPILNDAVAAERLHESLISAGLPA